MKYPAVTVVAVRPVEGIISATSSQVANATLAVLHLLTYLPLVVLPALQDAHLKLAVVLNTSLCLCLMAGNLCFYHLGIVKVHSNDVCRLRLSLSKLVSRQDKQRSTATLKMRFRSCQQWQQLL